MKRHLFLTGPIGCGKSTAIQTALGGRLSKCGGLLTRRCREPGLHFTLEHPDGSGKEVFLDLSLGTPVIKLDAFSERFLQGRVLLMDEIGGIELLNPLFSDALDAVLKSDVPVLGVVKGEGAAGALVQTLGLMARYEAAAGRLRNRLREDENTLLYECGQYDQKALLLAAQWAEEYLHDELF